MVINDDVALFERVNRMMTGENCLCGSVFWDLQKDHYSNMDYHHNGQPDFGALEKWQVNGRGSAAFWHVFRW